MFVQAHHVLYSNSESLTVYLHTLSYVTTTITFPVASDRDVAADCFRQDSLPQAIFEEFRNGHIRVEYEHTLIFNS